MESFSCSITRDVTVEVHLNSYHFFETTLDGGRFTGASLNELEEHVRKHLIETKKEYKIPVVLEGADGKTTGGLDHPTYTRAILRSKHGRTSEYLFLINGKKVSLEYPRVTFLGSEVTDEDLTWLNERAQQVSGLRQEIARYIQARQTRKRGYQCWELIKEAEQATPPAEPAKEEAH